MAVARCSVIGGPCVVVTCDDTYVTVGDVILDVRPQFRDISNALLGNIGQKLTDRLLTVRFTPIGRPDYATTLIPLNVSDVGDDVMGCSDCAMTIQGADGTFIQLKSVGILQPPSLTFSPNRPLYGEVTYGAVLANNTDLSTADTVKAITASNPFTIPQDACDLSAIIERPATAAWGASAPFNDIEMTEDGCEIVFEYRTTPKKTSLNGTIGFRLEEVIARARLRPANITEAQFFSTLLPVDGSASGVAMGGEGAKNDLTIEHSPNTNALTVLLRDAYVSDAGGSLQWGANADRFGVVELRSSVKCDGSGNLLAPFTITVN